MCCRACSVLPFAALGLRFFTSFCWWVFIAMVFGFTVGFVFCVMVPFGRSVTCMGCFGVVYLVLAFYLV